MNKIFKPFLHKFLKLLFDDILIYIKAWESHINCVDKSLKLLIENKIFLKHSKCDFGAPGIEYLGHIVIQDGVLVDPKKVVAMQDWSYPKTIKIFRGFLGLTSYYTIFLKNYGEIVAPLTSLKRNSFVWSEVTT